MCQCKPDDQICNTSTRDGWCPALLFEHRSLEDYHCLAPHGDDPDVKKVIPIVEQRIRDAALREQKEKATDLHKWQARHNGCLDFV